MKLRSCLIPTSTSSTAAATSPTPNSLLSHGSTTSSHSQTPSLLSSSSSSTSIQTNLSLPSLQKHSHFSPPNTATISSPTTIKPPAHADRRSTICFLALHDNLLYAAAGNEIYVYQITSRTLIHTFNAANISGAGSVKSIAFLDGKVFTAHQDGKIRVWNLQEGKHNLVATLPTLADRLRRVILPRNYVQVRRHKKKLSIEHYDAVSSLAVTPDQNALLSVSWDRSMKLWEPRSFRCLEAVDKAHDDAINAVAVSKDGLVYTGSADKRIKVWKKEGKNYGAVATLERHKSAVNALALSGDGSVLFSGSCDRSILVWEREDSANYMAVSGALRGHAKAILCLINVQDLLLSGSADRTVRIWRRGVDGRYCCLTVLNGHQTPVRSLAAETGHGHSGVMVFSGSFDGEIKIWQVECPHNM